MKFSVNKKESPVKEEDIHGLAEIDIAYKFAKCIYREFGQFLRAIVLFGSRARNPGLQGGSDIDILLIVDDVSYYITPEVIEAYRVILEETIIKTSKRLHVTTLKFTSFWEYIRVSDPIGINILRDGVALIDTGFFSPLQALLYQGRIRPTKEATIAYFSKAPQTIFNSRWHIMQAGLDLYWAVIDAAHAALMKAEVLPQRPEKVADLLDEHLVKKKLISKECPKTMMVFYELSRKILHREMKEMNGKDYEIYHSMAKSFVDEVKRYIDKP
ncbi:nucleotidyltransferase domain-containing protein [Candidatus Woesearchaeota archaeon]|nr:nucleotidyltransferase domain-containing protein [Candidatus Woesearchaeota archaeon]